MVIGYHVIFGTYGFWLPNDPRGSWSDFVWSWELFRFGGKATKTDTRQSVAAVPHDVAKRLEMKKRLQYPHVVFNGEQARAVARGFAKAVDISQFPVYACSIMPEHIHLVFGRCRIDVEKVVRQLKQNATMRLKEENLHPLAAFEGQPKPWAESCWKVFLNTEESLRKAIRYVEENPVKEGKRPQQWSFVKPYTGESGV